MKNEPKTANTALDALVDGEIKKVVDGIEYAIQIAGKPHIREEVLAFRDILSKLLNERARQRTMNHAKIDGVIEEFQQALDLDFPECSGKTILSGVYPDPDQGLTSQVYAYYLKQEALDLEERGDQELAALHHKTFDKLFKLDVLPVQPQE
jgi:hypothetical protein